MILKLTLQKIHICLSAFEITAHVHDGDVDFNVNPFSENLQSVPTLKITIHDASAQYIQYKYIICIGIFKSNSSYSCILKGCSMLTKSPLSLFTGKANLLVMLIYQNSVKLDCCSTMKNV